MFLEVYSISMWMKRYGHATPKRTTLLGNTGGLVKLLTGKLHRSEPSQVKTSCKYTSKKGHARWKGSPELKSTQPLGFIGLS